MCGYVVREDCPEDSILPMDDMVEESRFTIPR